MDTSNQFCTIDETKEMYTIISDNLRKLIAQQGITQKELANKMGIAPASMTDYCKGRRMPAIEFFMALKKHYGISIDDFLTKSINPSGSILPARNLQADPAFLTTCQKYCGTYFVYYFDTSKFKGRDTQIPRASLLYGILYIYENPSLLDMPEYSCAAVLGISSRDNVISLKKTIESFKNPQEVIEYIEKNHASTAYYGDFELSQEHAFVSMNHASTDKALLIFYRVDNNKPNYAGGIGTINSVSKGRQRMPVVQFMGISRYRLSMSPEEIHHCLLLNYPTFRAEQETDEMIQNFKTLYVNDGEPKEGFSELQKSLIVRSTLERYIRKSLERNMFRYGKISERDDDEWYHAIKEAIKETDDKND